jgi:hypothetical protein
MRGVFSRVVGALVVPGLLVLAFHPGSAQADDTSFFGRLFRLGGSSSSSSSSTSSTSSANSTSAGQSGSPGSQAPSSAFGDIGNGSSFSPPGNAASRMPNPNPNPNPAPAGGPTSSDGPSTPDLSGTQDGQPRLSPRPRVSSAVTTADPLLTRMALGRSNDGSQFGMLLQVFADGTVIDSEGVHRLSASELRPLVEATQNSELTHVRGHCGTPSNDFIEYVHVVIFERRMGRLQAHSFSYAGNAQGCDNGIRYLHTALENLQAKLSRQPAATAATGALGSPPVFAPVPAATSPRPATRSTSTSTTRPVNGPATAPPLPDPSAVPGPGSSTGSVITLTPITPR